MFKGYLILVWWLFAGGEQNEKSSNWELLCIYCHDNEHSRLLDAEWLSTQNPDKQEGTTATHSPFADLKKLLNKHRNDEGRLSSPLSLLQLEKIW